MGKGRREDVPDAFQKTAFNCWWMFGSQLGTPVCMKETKRKRPLLFEQDWSPETLLADFI